MFWPALTAKLTAGLCLGLIYLFYYDGVGDTWLYFNDGQVLSAFARRDPLGYLSFLWKGEAELAFISDVALQPRTLYLLKLTSVFNLLSHDNYWITSAYFSLVSFLAAWYVVCQLTESVPSAYWPAVAGFLFFPSAIFWSSGLIKESVAMAGLFLLGGCFLRVWFGYRLRFWEWILIPVAVWVVWSLKYYFLGVWIPVAMASLCVHRASAAGWLPSALFPRILLWGASLAIPLALVLTLHPNFEPHHLAEVIVDNYRAFHDDSRPDDLVYYDGLNANWSSILLHSPKALVAGLFRPTLWEAGNLWQYAAALENAVLILLFLTAVGNLRSFTRSPQRLLVVTVLLFSAILATFLALSTPNLGTLSRYRVGFLSPLVTVLATGSPLFQRLCDVMQRYHARLAR